jgi:ParB family chromosome partitioning protein
VRRGPSVSTRFEPCPTEARAAWLGYAVARTLEASANSSGERVCDFHDHLARLLGVEVVEMVAADGANYFDRVAKAVTLAGAGEVGGTSFAAGSRRRRRRELSETAERIFAGRGRRSD